MNTKPTTKEEKPENISRIDSQDQAGGIFSHDDNNVTKSNDNVHINHIISPVMSDDAEEK